jgi:hypothetical protein
MATIIRRGKAVTLTLDHDAAALLRVIAPSNKGHGRFLSELIRNELVRREERQKVLAELASQQAGQP